MRESSGTGFSSTFLRWAMLIVVAANIGFIVDYSNLSASATIAAVVVEYGDTFVPAGFAKGMGGALLASLPSFFLAALRPRRRGMRIYDKLVVPLALASVLAASWVVAFRHKEIGLSLALVAASVVLGGVMFARVARVSPGRYSGWLRVPFSLYFGAMTLALLVVAPLWLNASGFLAGTMMEQHELATAFFAIATTAGGVVALRYRDPVYPAVIAAAAGSIFVAQRGYDPLAATALVVCVGMLVVAGFAAVALARQPGRDRTNQASRRRVETVRPAKAERWHLMEASTSIMRV